MAAKIYFRRDFDLDLWPEITIWKYAHCLDMRNNHAKFHPDRTSSTVMSQKWFLTGSCDLDPRSRFLHATHHPDIGDNYAKFHLNLIINIKLRVKWNFDKKLTYDQRAHFKTPNTIFIHVLLWGTTMQSFIQAWLLKSKSKVLY